MNEIKQILFSISDVLFQTDESGKILYISPSIENIFGFSKKDIIGSDLSTIFYKENDQTEYNDWIQKLGAIKKNHISFEVKMKKKDQSLVWVKINLYKDQIKDNETKNICGTIQDISQTKKLEDMLSSSLDRFKILFEEHFSILENSPSGIIKINNKMIVTYLNPALKEILGIAPGSDSEALGFDITRLPPVINAGFVPSLEKIAQKQRIKVEGPFESLYGKKSYLLVNGVPLVENDKFAGAVFVIEDITQIKELALTLKYQASHDSLTRLMNRREFERLLYQTILDAKKNMNTHVLCYMDLDQFKIVNDTCGHVAGDLLLQQISPILTETLNPGDHLARLGGDEFGVILHNCTMKQAREFSIKLQKSISRFNFYYNNQLFKIGTSIGLASIDSNTANIAEILNSADSACYHAKEKGRNKIYEFHENDSALKVQRTHTEWFNNINQVIDSDRFTVYIQPIQQLSKNAKFNFAGEVLVRIINNNAHLITPDSFIPTAERYQLMSKIDKIVIEKAFSILHNQKNYGRSIFTINLSAQSISEDGFSDFIIKCFQKYSVPAEFICFEITESAVITNITSAIQFIKKLKENGSIFALDDFGSGISSLTNLKKLPVDVLKVSGEFIKNILNNEIDQVMLKSIIEISRAMNLYTIAEFIENQNVIDMVTRMGVDYGQGNYIGAPVPMKGI